MTSEVITETLNMWSIKLLFFDELTLFEAFPFQVLSIAAYTNPLNPDAYPGLRKMEAEVVRFTTDIENCRLLREQLLNDNDLFQNDW